jgi:hypothetical protein
MNSQINRVPFSKIFLTALFAGLIATIICLGYNIWFRVSTFFGPSDFINVSSIIFIVNLLLLVAGTAYYALKSWSGRGDLIYTLLFLLITIFCIWKTTGIQRFADLKLNAEFIKLLLGVVLIVGIAALSIPYIYNHKKLMDLFYEEDV